MSKSYCVLFIIYAVSAPENNVSCWPAGTYGIPMPQTGCPETAESEWRNGTRTHKTEPGSKASGDIHLAGITKKATNKVVQSFCMKTGVDRNGDYVFQPGSYCIFKLGTCPEGFREGWIYWDDDDGSWFGRRGAHASTGTLPDGSYSKNTKMYYCCRNDGPASEPLKRLPTDLPFYLLKWGDECQKVKGMHVTEEWVFWSDESVNNHNSEGGLHPTVVRERQSDKSTTLFYCYYQTKTDHLWLVIVTGTMLGIIVILSLVFITIRLILVFKKQMKPKSVEPDPVVHFTNANAETDAPRLSAEEELTECVCGSPGGLTITSDDVFTPCDAEENPELRGQGEHAPLVFQCPRRYRTVRLPSYDEAIQTPTLPTRPLRPIPCATEENPEVSGQTEQSPIVFQFPGRHHRGRVPSYEEAIGQAAASPVVPPNHFIPPIREET